jgi:hypothetical protein
MQDHHRQLGKIHLQRTVGPYIWVTFDRGSGLCRAAYFRFAPKADVRSL